jgi:hypothetical protein
MGIKEKRMKLFALAAAASLAATAMIPAAASADRHAGHGWKWKQVCTTKMWHGHKHKECHRQHVRW